MTKLYRATIENRGTGEKHIEGELTAEDIIDIIIDRNSPMDVVLHTIEELPYSFESKMEDVERWGSE